MLHGELTKRVIGLAMKVHSGLGPGFVESVYQKALVYELKKAGLQVQTETPIAVWYSGIVVGRFVADLVVDASLLVENKAVVKLVPAHEVQLVNYLTATGLDLGLILNFGARSLEFSRKVRLYDRHRVDRVNRVEDA